VYVKVPSPPSESTAVESQGPESHAEGSAPGTKHRKKKKNSLGAAGVSRTLHSKNEVNGVDAEAAQAVPVELTVEDEEIARLTLELQQHNTQVNQLEQQIEQKDGAIKGMRQEIERLKLKMNDFSDTEKQHISAELLLTKRIAEQRARHTADVEKVRGRIQSYRVANYYRTPAAS